MPIFVAADEAFVVAALKAGLVPEALASAPVRCAAIAQGLALEPAVEVSAAHRRSLTGAGFVAYAGNLEGVTTRRSWPEVVATRRAAEPEPPLPHVLLMCPRTECARLVGALLRLGCDDQELCFFADEDGLELVACRTVAPPYYVVLAAIERGGSIEAYLPVDGRQRTWIAAGWEHPLACELEPPIDRLLLLRSDAPWRRVPDGPWRSITQHTTLEVPAAVALQRIDAQERYTVKLGLVRSSLTNVPSLWVLRDEAIDAVDRLVLSMPAAALDGLAFAVLCQGPARVVAIRARRLGRAAPPPIELPGAEVYATLPLLERIHVPVNTTISPPLRVERLAAAIAPQPDRLAWLVRLADGSPAPFRVETVPEDAFEPLGEWVDHVAEQHAEPLQRWMAQAVFEFEPFTSEADTASSTPDRARRVRPRQAPASPEPEAPLVPVVSTMVVPPARPLHLEIRELQPSELAQELARIESTILDHEGAADDPELTTRWVALAVGYAQQRRGTQAALAWAHALWETPRGELHDARAEAWRRAEAELGGPDAFTLVDDPSADRVRALAVQVIAGRTDEASITDWLRVHDARLPTRVYWLLWHRLSTATADTLARMRATDAVLDRLRGGLSARDVPAFVRADTHDPSGSSSSGELADELLRTQTAYAKARRQRSTVEAAPELTDGYVQLMFAWGFARLGRDDDSRRAVALADELHCGTVATPTDPVHAFLRATFRDRVRQALEGMPLETPLSPERIPELERLDRYQRYKVDRLRQASVILDWSPNLDPFAAFGVHRKGNERALGDARPETIAAAVDSLLWEQRTPEVLQRAVALGRVLPDHLAVPRLSLLLEAAATLPAYERVAVLEGITLIAGRCEHAPTLAAACDGFAALFDDAALDDRIGPALALARLSGTLRRSGQAPRVLAALAFQYEALLGGEVERIVARLQLAAAMATLGDPRRLPDATAAGLEVLGRGALVPAHRSSFTRNLMLALGRASPERAIAGVRALLDGLPTVTDSFNTNSHFCLSVLGFVESLVLGLARPDVVGSERTHRFVDNDEHRIRQRLFAASARFPS